MVTGIMRRKESEVFLPIIFFNSKVRLLLLLTRTIGNDLVELYPS